MGLDKFLLGLQVILDGYRIEDHPTEKKPPIKANVLELLFDMGNGPCGSTLGQLVRDLNLIAFNYLLCVGEYTFKGAPNELKQTVQFKLEEITIFCRNEQGQL